MTGVSPFTKKFNFCYYKESFFTFPMNKLDFKKKLLVEGKCTKANIGKKKKQKQVQLS